MKAEAWLRDKHGREGCACDDTQQCWMASLIAEFDQLHAVVDAARAMIEDGFPHTDAGDEWFAIVSRRLAALDAVDKTPADVS